MSLDNKTLKKFLEIAGEKLSGDWILIGGTVLPVLGIHHRATVDIDFVSKNKKEETLKLMEIADELGLSVETINQAGAFFLYQVPNFEDELILLYKGSRAKIFRPNLLLYLKLKIKRLSESDFLDCVEYIKYSKKKNELQSLGGAIKTIKFQINKESDKEKKNRLQQILNLLEID